MNVSERKFPHMTDDELLDALKGLNPREAAIMRLSIQTECLLENLNALNVEGQLFRSRELSLAITNIEQGSHWLAALAARLGP